MPTDIWKRLDLGHKINMVLLVAALMAIVAGKWWNPFELGRDYEKHCIRQAIEKEAQDTLNNHIIKENDYISLISRADAADNPFCKSYFITKKRP